MSLLAAIVSTALAATTPPSALCAGCTLDAPAAQAAPLVVVLGDAELARTWRAPAKAAGVAVLTLARWERAEPIWIEEQVFAAARQRSIDLARVYLVGGGEGAAYIGRHADALSETFAAVVVSGGAPGPMAEACPSEPMPAHFSGEPDAALRGYFDRCRGQVMVSRQPVPAVLDWLRRHVRVTTVS